jgi:hypothetical protein
MNILSQADIKKIYRISGTPENYLTALRYKVWGFNKESKKNWDKLLPGDIIFFHSKSSDSEFFKSTTSCIVGFGVVGNNFFFNEEHLWIDEKLHAKSYPYRFSFSEIFLFTDIPVNDDWDSTTINKIENTRQIITKLLESGIPLSDLGGFPHMGSYSSINDTHVRDILLSSDRRINFFEGDNESEIIMKSAELKELGSEAEALRYATTLTVFDDIRERIVGGGNINFNVSLDKLAKAEKSHFDIVSYLRLLLSNKGYRVYANNHVDLFAYNQKTSMLIEAKSIENQNFKSQSRKGMVQLFEYNYFEVSNFKNQTNLNFQNEFKILATSDCPIDNDYVQFINSMDIKTIAVKDSRHITYGKSINLDNY